MKFIKEWLQILGSLLVIGAFYSHYAGHSFLLFEIILLIIGTLMVIISIIITKKTIEQENQKGLLIVILTRYITENQCRILLPIFGFLVLLSWTVWKVYINNATDLKMEDFIVTIFALSLVLYYSGHSKIQMEKDFVILYLIFLTIIFILLWKGFSLITGESYSRINTFIEYYSVTIPAVTILQLLGMNINAVLNLTEIGLSNIIEYEYGGHLLRVGIGASCSGLYSIGLFFSAFLSFVIVRYRRINRNIIIALAIGLAVVWISNLIRIITTILVGIYYGPVALSQFHMYFGIFIFIILVTIFWILIVRWLDRVEQLPSIPREIRIQDDDELVNTVTSKSD